MSRSRPRGEAGRLLPFRVRVRVLGPVLPVLPVVLLLLVVLVVAAVGGRLSIVAVEVAGGWVTDS